MNYLNHHTQEKRDIDTGNPGLIDAAEYAVSEMLARMKANGGKCIMCDQAYAPGIPHDADCAMDLLAYAIDRYKEEN